MAVTFYIVGAVPALAGLGVAGLVLIMNVWLAAGTGFNQRVPETELDWARGRQESRLRTAACYRPLGCTRQTLTFCFVRVRAFASQQPTTCAGHHRPD